MDVDKHVMSNADAYVRTIIATAWHPMLRRRMLLMRMFDSSCVHIGKEAGLYIPSGTMGNLLAAMIHCAHRGSEMIVGDQSHMHCK